MINRFTKIALFAAAFCIIFGASAYVTLTLLIKSEDTVVVPDLVGKDAVQALKVLSDLGLNIKVKGSETSDRIPKNHVIFQEPAPGTEIKSGRQVRIIISKGAGTVLTPDLVGLSVQQARLTLEDAGLCSGQKSYTPHPATEKNRIIAQVPSPGAQIDRGRCVDLLISTGHRALATKMPDLENRSIDEAVEQIEANNLTLGEIKSVYHKDRPKNAVIGQQPRSGWRVTEGTVVHLVINKMPGKKDGKRSDDGGFIRYRVKPGFLKRHIRVQLDGFGVSEDIFNAFVKPGEEIWVLVPTSSEATVRVYEDNELVISRVFD